MKSLKIHLELNDQQSTLAMKHVDVARHAIIGACPFVWKRIKMKKNAHHLFDLHKKLVAEVKPVYSWYYEVSKCSPQEALINLDKAYKKAFKEKNG